MGWIQIIHHHLIQVLVTKIISILLLPLQWFEIIFSTNTFQKDSVSLRLKTPCQLRFQAQNSKKGKSATHSYVCKARALVYKMPGNGWNQNWSWIGLGIYSSYAITASGSPVIITEDAFRRIELALKTEVEWDNINPNQTVPKEKVIIALPPGTEWLAKQDLINGLRVYLDPDFHVYVIFYYNSLYVVSMILKIW